MKSLLFVVALLAFGGVAQGEQQKREWYQGAEHDQKYIAVSSQELAAIKSELFEGRKDIQSDEQNPILITRWTEEQEQPNLMLRQDKYEQFQNQIAQIHGDDLPSHLVRAEQISESERMVAARYRDKENDIDGASTKYFLFAENMNELGRRVAVNLNEIMAISADQLQDGDVCLRVRGDELDLIQVKKNRVVTLKSLSERSQAVNN